jgi:hypothetical protein
LQLTSIRKIMLVKRIALVRAFAVVTLVVVGMCGSMALGNTLQLVTESEAALPLDKSVDRAITRGPFVVVLFPPQGAGMIQSPFNLRLRFESRGGATINVDSVLVTYRRIPAIDLTQRIRQFIRPDGIVVENANVPPGVHRIRVDVRDSQGRTGLADFIFTVAK